MIVVSRLQLILAICYIIGRGEGNIDRRRRQATGDNNRNGGLLSSNSDGVGAQKNIHFNPSNNLNNQQQSNNNVMQSSQGQQQQQQLVRSRGFYSNPEFKPPSFSGNKPVGWFDTKYPYWVSDQNSQSDKTNVVDGKNAPPSSLQSNANLPRRDDGGAFYLQKVARQYANKGEKSFNMNQFNGQQRRGSMCTNVQNFNGYTFGKFPCPLPPGTGMNQLDQYCCGSANYQYCCNAQEYNQDQAGGFGNNVFNDRQRHAKTLHYSPAQTRTLAIVLPIVGILVIAGAVIIVFLYYKKLRNEQTRDGKSSNVARPTNSYSAVSQDSPVDKPFITPRKEQQTTVQS